MVERFTPDIERGSSPDYDDPVMRPDEFGGYVRFSDYEAAESRASALSAEVERLRGALEDMLFEYGDKYDSECRLKSANELEIIKRARASLNGGSDHG